jgi:transposase-like protein
MLGRWVQESQADEQEAFRGNGKLTEEQQELRRLREENRRLKLEREILKNPPSGASGPAPVAVETLVGIDFS